MNKNVGFKTILKTKLNQIFNEVISLVIDKSGKILLKSVID